MFESGLEGQAGVISVAVWKKLQLCWQQQQRSSIISLEGQPKNATYVRSLISDDDMQENTEDMP
jgi:hypothetical protein